MSDEIRIGCSVDVFVVRSKAEVDHASQMALATLEIAEQVAVLEGKDAAPFARAKRMFEQASASATAAIAGIHAG